MSRFVLVELYEDLEDLPGEPRKTSRPSVFRGLKLVPGVKCVSDTDYVPRAELVELGMPETEIYEYQARERRKRTKKAQV